MMISLKMNVIARVDIEVGYYNIATSRGLILMLLEMAQTWLPWQLMRNSVCKKKKMVTIPQSIALTITPRGHPQ